MNDPKLIEAAATRIPDEWRRNYSHRPADRLAGDVTKAFDRLWIMEREKDQMRAALIVQFERIRKVIAGLSAFVTVLVIVEVWRFLK